MRRHLLRAVCLPLTAILLLGPVAPAIATPGAPVVTLEADIPSPDGQSGWWRTPAQAFAICDQDASLHYDWGAAETSLAVLSGALTSLGFAPEGEATVTATASNSAEETSTPVTRRFRTDSAPPTRVEALTASADGGVVTLTWDPASDDTSGVRFYTVYRNLTGPPFSVGDVIAYVDGDTTFTETDQIGGGVWFYGVRAVDTAGNGSLMSDAVRASADATPPSAPGDLQAWLNGRGFVRVSWEPGFDAGTGVSGYAIERAFPGQEFSAVATVPAGALAWDDEDFDAVAEDCSYRVFAVDRAGNRSLPAGPAQRGIDAGAPGVPDEPFARGDLPDDGHPLHTLPVAFALTWVAPADEGGSGIARYEVAYGPDAETPAWVRYTGLTTLSVSSTAEWADWWFSVRAEDRAGNVSEWAEPVEQRVATFDEVVRRGSRGAPLSPRARPRSRARHDVVIASAWSFPDGLAASSLAGTLRAPVLLVGPGPLRADVSAEIERLGAVNAWVIGGPPAVADATFASLQAVASGEVTRVAGADRYATAAAVASTVRGLRGGAPGRVIVVSGRDFPDALSVGPLSYVTGWPLVFATPTGLPAASRDAITASGATGTLIVGSSRAVWAGVEALVVSPDRLSGIDRYDDVGPGRDMGARPRPPLCRAPGARHGPDVPGRPVRRPVRRRARGAGAAVPMGRAPVAGRVRAAPPRGGRPPHHRPRSDDGGVVRLRAGVARAAGPAHGNECVPE